MSTPTTDILRHCPICGATTRDDHCPTDGTATFRMDGIDVVAAANLTIGEVFADRYRILSRIGKGGFGAVYEAVHTGSGQHVAVKVLALDPGDTGRDVFFRFFREARITAQLNHPNTVRLYDFGQSQTGALFMVLELLRGETLERRLSDLHARDEVMDGREAAKIAVAILRSIGEAHAAGLVHRDLKPDNVILARSAEDETVVKVLDFGIARSMDSRLTGMNRVLGTPAYMSPEQCRGSTDLDGRSDLYALGVILFRAVTGRLPFTGDVFALLWSHQEEPAPDLRLLARTPLPDAFIEIVQRALAKAPEQRFPDARSMRHALEMTVSGAWQPTPRDVPLESEDTADLLVTDVQPPAGGSATPVIVRGGAGATPNFVSDTVVHAETADASVQHKVAKQPAAPAAAPELVSVVAEQPQTVETRRSAAPAKLAVAVALAAAGAAAWAWFAPSRAPAVVAAPQPAVTATVDTPKAPEPVAVALAAAPSPVVAVPPAAAIAVPSAPTPAAPAVESPAQPSVVVKPPVAKAPTAKPGAKRRGPQIEVIQ